MGNDTYPFGSKELIKLRADFFRQILQEYQKVYNKSDEDFLNIHGRVIGHIRAFAAEKSKKYTLTGADVNHFAGVNHTDLFRQFGLTDWLPI